MIVSKGESYVSRTIEGDKTWFTLVTKNDTKEGESRTYVNNARALRNALNAMLGE